MRGQPRGVPPLRGRDALRRSPGGASSHRDRDSVRAAGEPARALRPEARPVRIRRSTDASMSLTVSPLNSRRPESISNRTPPNAQMSARVDRLAARLLRRHVRGGAENDARLRHRRRGERRRLVDVGRPTPASAADAFARPKSSTLTVPSSRTLMFAGFRSRWTMPCSCAASSASAICRAIGERSCERHRAARDALLGQRPRPRPAPSRDRVLPSDPRGRRSCAMFG